LAEICSRFKIEFVEDAAESLGSYRDKHHTGTFAKLATLSFNGNKIVTTGGGGMILTGDAEFAARAKHLTTTAKLSHRWEFRHDQIGYNYRLPNVNAALGCAQMEQLPAFLSAKRRLAESYKAAFAGVSNARFLEEPADCRSNYWLNAIGLDGGSVRRRDEYLSVANDAGIGLRPVWNLMHKLPMYADCPRSDLSVSQEMEAAILNLPSGASLAEKGG
jgi:perosamine synthetase